MLIFVLEHNNVFIFCFYYIYLVIIFFFFFFQAEDGIRDFHVTGVQTCALPISLRRRNRRSCHRRGCRGPPRGEPRPREWPCPNRSLRTSRPPCAGAVPSAGRASAGSGRDDALFRSEERRVGKECRLGWWSESGK